MTIAKQALASLRAAAPRTMGEELGIGCLNRYARDELAPTSLEN